MVDYVDANYDGKDMELKHLFAMFGMEVIATTGFGFEANIFADPNSIFRDKVGLVKFRVRHFLW